MYSDEIKNVITEYLNNSNAEYAVMIDGEWGTGKTYFLKHSLLEIMDNIDNGKDKRRKCAYVSLYGLKSIDEVSKEIIFQFLGKKNKGKVEALDTVIDTAGNILSASLGAVNIDLSKAKGILEKIDIKNWLICFDDLERCCISVNEVLGYMNHLVEHNNCKVIVLANEKEMGKIKLNQKLEEKYQVVLMGQHLLLSNENNSSTTDKIVDIEKLQKETKALFNEDIIYQIIKEKVIGLTIRYEPRMEEVYDLIINEHEYGGKFKEYLIENKAKILQYFKELECYNLRTLISVFGTIRKVYDEMTSKGYNNTEYFTGIMEEFVKYIVRLSIYFKNGGNVGKLDLSSGIGYVSLKKDGYKRTKGFKFLEKYCTTMSFSEEEFIETVSQLRKEYKEEEARILQSKHGQAYSELANWWKKEDDEVCHLIMQLREEIHQDQYSFHIYQSIIGQLMVIRHWGHNIGDMEELIEVMNQNIEKSETVVDIDRHSYSFEESALKKEYEAYINRLNLKVEDKNRIIKITEISKYLDSANWAEELFGYCNDHFNDFIARNGFIDLINIDLLLEKMQNASAKELCLVKDMFSRVYEPSNIKAYLMADKEKIQEFKEKVEKISLSGINKPLAIDNLIKKLDDIIERL